MIEMEHYCLCYDTDSVADCGSSGAISTAATGGMKNVLDANGNVIGHQNCIGWSTDPNATTPIVSSNFYVVDNLTLYMVWGPHINRLIF